MANEITYLWNDPKYEKNKGANHLEKFLNDPKKSARNNFHALNINQEDIEQAMYNLNKRDESWSKAFPKGITRATGFVIKNQLDAYYNNYSEMKPSEIFTVENIKKMSMPEISESVSELTKARSLKGDLENIKDTSNESIFSLGRMGLIDLNDKGLNMSVDSKRVVSSESSKAFRDKVQAVNEKYSKEKAAENDDKDKMSFSDVQKLVNDSNDEIQAFSRKYYASHGGMPNYDNINLGDYSSKNSDGKNAENTSKQKKVSEAGDTDSNDEKSSRNVKQKSDGGKIVAAAAAGTAAGAGAEVLLNNKKKNVPSDQLTVTADTNKIGAANPLIPNQNNGGAANTLPTNPGDSVQANPVSGDAGGNAPAAPSSPGESGSAGSNNNGGKEKDSSNKNAEKNAKAQAAYNNMLTKRKVLEDAVVKKHYNASTKTFDMTPETLDKEIKSATDAANKAESNIKVKGSKATQKEIEDKEQKVATKNGLIKLKQMYNNYNNSSSYKEPYFYKEINSRGGKGNKKDAENKILEKIIQNTNYVELRKNINNALQTTNIVDEKSRLDALKKVDSAKKILPNLNNTFDVKLKETLNGINNSIAYTNDKIRKYGSSSDSYDTLENLKLNLQILNDLQKKVESLKDSKQNDWDVYKGKANASSGMSKGEMTHLNEPSKDIFAQVTNVQNRLEKKGKKR